MYKYVLVFRDAKTYGREDYTLRHDKMNLHMIIVCLILCIRIFFSKTDENRKYMYLYHSFFFFITLKRLFSVIEITFIKYLYLLDMSLWSNYKPIYILKVIDINTDF